MNEKATVPGWPGWETVRLIGRGSFGSVYEIERDIFGVKEKAALKIISIPQNDSEITELYSDGYDSESITERFQEHLKDIVREYSLVAALKGHPNIVRCDDIRYVQHDDGIGWDIYIRMELLTPLMDVLPSVTDVGQAVQIGEDLCKALAECQKNNLIHRDIKPQNIFLSPNGDYKLGDFGIAKSVDRTTSGTKTGTYKYMAPEVYNNQPYGSAADIYSLGLTMYWLLNERRTPFLPLPPTKPRISEEDAARARRFRGEPLPAPAHGSEELKRIVLKACAYDPKDRYHTADEMLHDLNALSVAEKPQDAPATVPPVTPPEEEEDDKTVGAWTVSEEPATEAAAETEEDETVSAWAVPEEPATEAAAQTEEDKTVGVWTQTPETKKPEPAPAPAPAPKKQKKWWLAAVAAVAVVAVAIAGTHGGKTAQTAPKPTSAPTSAPTAVPTAVPTATAASTVPANDQTLLGVDMTPEEFEKELALLVEDAQSWTNETAPQTLDEFPLLPQSLLSLLEYLRNARSELEITDTTLTWTTDISERLAGIKNNYNSIVERVEEPTFCYISKNVMEHFPLESVGNQIYTVNLPENAVEEVLSDETDSTALFQMYVSLNEWYENLTVQNCMRRADDELCVWLDISNKEYSIRWVLNYEFDIYIRSSSSGRVICKLAYDTESGLLVDMYKDY